MEYNNLSQVYRIIEQSRIKYGSLKKCELHIHTPASHDFRLVPGKKYKSMSISELIEIAHSEGLFDIQKKQILLDRILKGEYEGDEYRRALLDQNIPFESLKEYIAYQLIAHKLYNENIEVALITDHNTIAGYSKLKFSLEEYFKSHIKFTQPNRKSIHLFLGIEISCSEQNHLVGIFDEKKYDQLQYLIKEYIISEEEGTYETSYNMIERIVELDGIPYIAHVNSSNFLGTGLYNQTLYGSDNLNILGLTNYSRKEATIERLNSFTTKTSRFCFLHEGDSHDLETIGKRNTWIKFSKVSFQALKKALKNHNFCVYPEEPYLTNKYIKGMIIEPGEKGFLRGRPGQKNDTRFFIDFSKDLNCIIGGRGTGKSTILSTLQTIFTMETTSLESLKFVSMHKLVYVLFHLRGTDYIIKFIPQFDSDNNWYGGFLEKAFKNKSTERIILSEHWLELYKVKSVNDFELITKDRSSILEEIYKNSYSINNIINRINAGDTGSFIKEVIFNGCEFEDFKLFVKNLAKTPKNKFRQHISDNLKTIQDLIEQRKSIVSDTVEGFNIINHNLISINYSPKKKDVDFYLRHLFNEEVQSTRILNTKLRWMDVETYVYEMVTKIGFLEFISLLINEKTTELEKNYKISSFVSFPDAESEDISSKNIRSVFKQIRNRIIDNKEAFLTSLIRYLEVVDDFSISFNVNSKESLLSQTTLMRNINELSLGQKVVATLTFLFNYGKYSNDNSPMIIDQPEDNLDNQYIYKNLVSSLRDLKNSRQVILVTHSSTIVTNADSEQVIVLNSNNKTGWIEQKGYPSDEKIMKYIIMYLEGGEPSFKHKMDMYSTVMN